MQLDIATISVVTVFVTALLGALLVFAGVQNHAGRAPMVWGAAHIASGTGLGLVTSHNSLPAFLAVDIGNALVFLGYGLMWAGARVFDRRPVQPLLLLLAPALWLMACRIPFFAEHMFVRIVVLSIALSMIMAGTARELWRGRAEPLMSRWSTAVALIIYSMIVLTRIPVVFFSNMLDESTLQTGMPFAAVAFGTLLFTVVTAFLLLNMTKERSELQHKINSLVDPLSGVANRRAFLNGAGGLIEQHTLGAGQLALLLFDLDRFKTINDRFGHAVGDRVLQTFARAAAKTLGPEVLFGRIGGEEFASLLVVGDAGEAYAIADRVRRNFAEAAARLGERGLAPTVSVGFALGLDPKDKVEDLLVTADAALYRAKANGRDRVEAQPSENDAATASAAVAPAEATSIVSIGTGKRRIGAAA